MAQLPALALAALLALEPAAAGGARPMRRGLVTQVDVGSSVCLRFVGPWARQRASRLQADLETAFRRRSVSFGCGNPRTTRAGAPPSYQLSLTVEEAVIREVTLEVTETTAPGSRSTLRIERYVDLRNVPVDGRHLALVVAADELLEAARRGRQARAPDVAAPPAAAGPTPPATAAASAAPEPRPASPPQSTEPPRTGTPRAPVARAEPPPTPPPLPAPPPPPPPEPPPEGEETVRSPVATAAVPPAAPGDTHHEAALSFAVERYAGGQTHLGPELAWSYGRDRGAFAVLGVGARAGLVAKAVSGVVESSLWTGRLAFGTGLLLGGDWLRAAVEVGARLGRLRLQGRATAAGYSGRDVSSWLCYTDATVSLRIRIVPWVQTRLSAGVGLPLLGQRALESDDTVTAATGLAALAQIGALVVF